MAGDDNAEWAAVPAADPSRTIDDEAASTLEVDGEVFEPRPHGFGGTHYNWISGPHPGHGFSMSPTPDSFEQHQASIRGFLSMVDPASGHIDDD